MASIIKIKRSTTADSIPNSLQEGELAVNLFDRKLYVGNSTGVTAISSDDATTTTKGVASFSSDNFSVTDGAVSIKDGGIVTAELADDAVTNAKLAADAVDSDQIADGAIDTVHIGDDQVTSAKIADNAVALGTQTTGNYVAGVSAGNNSIVISGSGSEGASVTVSLGDNIGANTSGKAATAGNADTATALETARNIGGVSFDGTANINLPGVNTTGNQDTTGNAGTATALETARTIGGVSFDGTANINLPGVNTTGNQDTTGNAGTATALETARNIGAVLVGDVTGQANVSFDGTGNAQAVITTTIAENSVALGTDTTGNYVATVSGTANEISVTGSGSESATVQIGLPDDVTIGNDLTVSNDLSVSGDVTVDGNLTVEGAVTYISSSTVNVDDSMLKLSANNAGDTVDTGVYGKYVVSGNSAVQYAGYFRDAGDGVFKFYTGLDTEPTTTVDTTDTGYGLAQVDAIIDGGTY